MAVDSGESGIMIALPDQAARTTQEPVAVPDGREVTFGRGSAGDPVDLPLDDPSGEPVAGTILPTEGFWRITNLSSTRSYVVENDEGGGEYLRVPPGRRGMPVPFTRARVTVPSARGLVSLTVTAPEPDLGPARAAPVPPDPPENVFSIDVNAKYFLVLLALCEPRLREASSQEMPGTSEIVRRLRGLEPCRSITRAAVNFHIDYLARRKFRVRGTPGAEPGSRPRANWQREAIIATALRFGVVRDDHLTLLDGSTHGD